jgi:hypothetical protein
MEDYRDAAKRHLDDADLLFAQYPQRLANASHLYGISAECSLKAVVREFNPNVQFHGKKGLKGHIPSLFAELSNVAAGLVNGTELVNQIRRLEPHFSGWDVSQRYEPQANFVAGTVSAQKTGATKAHLLMTNCLSGLL